MFSILSFNFRIVAEILVRWGIIIFLWGLGGVDVCGGGFEKGKRRGQSTREKGEVNHLLFSILTVNCRTMVREGGGPSYFMGVQTFVEGGSKREKKGGVIIFFMGLVGLDVCGKGFEKGKRRG